MAPDAWYRVATPRRGVREARSFKREEIAIAPGQAVAGAAPECDRNPAGPSGLRVERALFDKPADALTAYRLRKIEKY